MSGQICIAFFYQLFQAGDDLPVIRVKHDHLFQFHFSAWAFPEQILQCIQIGVGIQDNRIVNCFISQEDTQRSQNSGTQPHSLPCFPYAVAGHLEADVVYDIIENK